MFTGLVESLGRVVEVVPEPPGLRLVVDAGQVAGDASLGDSICTSGCCLSVVRIDGPRIAFELGPETLARTTLGGLKPGAPVNLERSLRLSDRLGGHLVTGHVDGMGRLASKVQEGDWVTCRFTAPPQLLAQRPLPGRVGRAAGVRVGIVRHARAQAAADEALRPGQPQERRVLQQDKGPLVVVGLERVRRFRQVERFRRFRQLRHPLGSG
jgi:riboflavin synthase